jgi:hypothetical protein
MSQNGKKILQKQSGCNVTSQDVCNVTKCLNVPFGRNVAIFMGKMDVKYVWMKCSHETKCHTVGLAKNVWTECSAVTFRPQKMFKTQCSGVDKQSIHLEIKCHSRCSEHLDIVLGGRAEGVETLLGRFKRGHFVKAPVLAASIFSETIGKSEYGLSKSIFYYWTIGISNIRQQVRKTIGYPIPN